MSHYESDTRQAYQDPVRAQRYKLQLEGRSYARFAIRRELVCVADALRRIGLGSSDSVLDIPCGTGVLAPVLKEVGAKAVIGDISEVMLRFACEAYGRESLRGAVRADIVDLPLESGSVSSCVCLGLMHRVPDEIRWRALGELARVSEGPLVVSFSVFGPSQAIKRAIVRSVRPGFGFAAFPLTLEKLRAELGRIGLRVVRLYRPLPVVSSEIVCIVGKGDGGRFRCP